MESKLLTVPEVAAALRISIQTARLYVWQNKLPVTRIGRRCLVDATLLQKYVEAHTKPAKGGEND